MLQLASTGALPAEMQLDEKRMVMLGAQLVLDSNSNTTLGAKEMEFSSSTSTLKQISINVSQAFSRALTMMGLMLNSTEEASVKLNDKFITDNMDANMVNAHLQAVVQGVMPQTSFYETARAVGLTNQDDEELDGKLKDEAFAVAGQSLEQVTSTMNEEAE